MTATHKQRAFTLIELLIYTGILIIIVAVIGSTLLALSKTYRSIISEQRVEQAAQNSMERMTREIRQATSIDVGNSAFGIASSTLSLNSTDAFGVAETLRFYIATSSIHLKINGVDAGPLTPASASVNSLVFRPISTGNSSAIKIEMSISSGTTTTYRSRNFYETAALRSGYDN